jgi:chromosomal replication initiation ATPase DnaA
VTQQMTFDFISGEDYSASNFIVFSGNMEAFCLLNRIKGDEGDPSGQIIFLVGEKKCGKTHLGHLWKQNHNARTIDLSELYELTFESFVQSIGLMMERFEFYIVDNFPVDIEDDKFFYLLDKILNNNSTILIISDVDRRKKRVILRDLESRIEASIFLKIGKLTRDAKPMLINKLFSDRQISIGGDVLKYLNGILATNYEIVYNCVDKICKCIHSELFDGGYRITVNFVKKILL